MRSNIIGGPAVVALVFLAFAPNAGADSIRLTRPGSGHEAASELGRAEGRSSLAGQSRMEALGNQFEGGWDFEKVNPFRRDNDHRRQFEQRALDEVRNFLGSRDFPIARTMPAELPHVTLPTDQGRKEGDNEDDDFVTLPPSLDEVGDTPSVAGSAGGPLATPEPASLILLGSGLVGLGVFGARRKRAR